MAPILLFAWLVLTLVTATVAKRRGRSFAGWLFLGLLLGPLALGIAAVMAGQKRCPFCGERIRASAAMCRYCGSNLSIPDSVSAVPDVSDGDHAFDQWLIQQGVAPETLSDAQREQLRGGYERSTLAAPPIQSR